MAGGNVGGGTGMRDLGYKAGIGTASRVMSIEGETTTLGVLVQSNFGGRLTIKGLNVAREFDLQDTKKEGGCSSIMITVVTDFPFSNRWLNRLAKRASFGIARNGSTG